MRLTAILGVLYASGFGGLWADDVIRFKTRDLRPPQVERPAARARHLILRFASRPGPRLLAELAERRFNVLAYLPDSALMVAVSGEPDLRGLGVTWAGAMEAADKISPALADDASGVYLLMFHPDVAAGIARGIVEDRGLQILENPGLLPDHLLVAGSRDDVLRLAAYDGVAYILPARTELALRKRAYGCPGALTPAGTVADYVLASSGWPKDAGGEVTLQYFFDSVTSELDSNTARSEIERALAEWARYANLSFSAGQQPSAARSIDILFASGAHGDAYPFVGTNVLAHTFYPAPPNTEPVAGDMHFNASEDWQVASGIDLFSVALHEAGHALGLGHSDNPEAVMYPYYKQATGLTSDDIAAIQALYGSPASQKATPPVTTPVTPPVTTPVTPPATPTTPTAPATGQDTTPPTIAITSPAFTIVSTTAASMTISGTASDNVGVTSVKWSASTGGSGTAAGTGTWSATVALLVGNNVITVRAYDAADNSGWRAVTIVRQ
jgi:hypothetical protein